MKVEHRTGFRIADTANFDSVPRRLRPAVATGSTAHHWLLLIKQIVLVAGYRYRVKKFKKPSSG